MRPPRPLLLFAAFALTGCQTTHVWDKGFPDKGDDPAVFQLESMAHDTVVAHGVRYTRESFAPIFRHATPEVLPALAAADARNEELELVSGGAITVITYAVPEDWPAYVSRIRDGVVVGSYLALFYFERLTKQAYDEAVAEYNAAVRRRLGARP